MSGLMSVSGHAGDEPSCVAGHGESASGLHATFEARARQRADGRRCGPLAAGELLDGYIYTWSNWLIAVPVNFTLGALWPIYWAILRPLFQ